ncbi:MAG: chemotaxis protein CheW [Nitrospirae bacterium]|nr:chemotaxis protein CheW [Nitrospirota bacterium]
MAEAVLLREDAEAEEIEQDQYLVFTVKGQEFGVQAMRIQEINAMQDIAEVPNAPHYVEGILNLRGRLVSVINFRKRFGFEAKEHDEDTRIIIMEHAGFPVGIIVDIVEEVIKIQGEKVQQIPPTATSSLPEGYITGVGLMDNRLIILLDADRILNKSDIPDALAMKDVIDSVQKTVAGGSERPPPQ